MKYFLDCEFIEGFRKPLFGKSRHYIDLISIGIVCDNNTGFNFISSEYNYNDASDWVKKNVILPLYINTVHGEARNRYDIHNFHKAYGVPNKEIAKNLLKYFGCWEDQLFWRAPKGIEIFGYYCDYDWVLLCSLFGRMIDLPKGFPMYCRDLKQTLDEKAEAITQLEMTKYVFEKNDHWKVTAPVGKEIINIDDYSATMKVELIKCHKDYPKQKQKHNALTDAAWNYELYKFLKTL